MFNLEEPFLEPYGAVPFRVTTPLGFRTVCFQGFYQVRSYTCGFASALMVVHHFYPRVDKRKLYKCLRTSREGTSQIGLIRGLRSFGVSVGIRYNLDFASLRQAVNCGKLVIGYDNDRDHWLVLCGYALCPDRVLTANPSPHYSSAYPWEELNSRLKNFGIICSRRGEKSLNDETRLGV